MHFSNDLAKKNTIQSVFIPQFCSFLSVQCTHSVKIYEIYLFMLDKVNSTHISLIFVLTNKEKNNLECWHKFKYMDVNYNQK